MVLPDLMDEIAQRFDTLPFEPTTPGIRTLSVWTIFGPVTVYATDTEDDVVHLVALEVVPGSGKTTLARSLGPAMGASVISKDVIKESLLDTLGTGDNDWAATLSRAAHGVMYELVQDLAGDVILEAHFHTGTAEAHLEALGRDLVQVYCRCPIEVAWQRYRARRDDPERHPGHLPEHQDDRATVGWRNSTPRPLDLDAPLLEVDTSGPVDIEAIADGVREVIE